MDARPFSGKLQPNMNKTAVTRVPIHDMIARRWSPRAFDPERPIEREKLLSLFEAARWAPSSSNLQPWHFIIAEKTDAAAYDALLACINERNQRWAADAPVLVIAVAAMMRNAERPNRHAWHDVGLAMGNLLAQATAHGLYVHQMAGFSPDKARETYAIPEGYEAVTASAIGYRAPPETLPDDLRERELAERKRKPLTDFVFGGAWGATAPLVNED
jgi:nitroreductase